jgi:hypothetical protein
MVRKQVLSDDSTLTITIKLRYFQSNTITTTVITKVQYLYNILGILNLNGFGDRALIILTMDAGEVEVYLARDVRWFCRTVR